ncbi:MAG: indolepyruvate ferredoxin oxidoreductase subunit alpha [Christensenellales bacterium]|jgi:indolepyruvate ferredoxin oxidoreductase alpha subunit
MKQIMLGNEAVARGAYEAGVKVIASYPGTPSTEITESAAQYKEIAAQWSPNEKVALEVAGGAAIAGARAMSCMKHVGLNVAADPLFTLSYTGINSGLVIAVADDPGMHSSQNEQDSRFYARSAHIPMLEPSDSAEALEYTKLAYELSEKHDTPVLLRLTTRISHSRSIVETGERAETSKEYVKDITKYVMVPAMAKGRHVVVEKRDVAIAEEAYSLYINRQELRSEEIGIICSGAAYQYVKEAVPEASILKLGMVWPLSFRLIEEFAAKVKKLYVIEELEPFLHDAIAARGICVEDRLFSLQGELSANIVARAFGVKADADFKEEQLPGRPPVMCPGCPHRPVFQAFNKLKLTVSGDIGCYSLGALPPHSSMDTCICMGAGISAALGMEKANDDAFRKKLVAVIGDSTFIHSGITGLIDMAYNGGKGTVVILDNSITGMTGHQQNPSTGKTLSGLEVEPANIEALCRAAGVKNVTVCDPFDVKLFEKELKAALALDELAVIIARRPCALIIKRLPPYTVTEDCRECGLCLKTGCPALSGLGGKTVIDEALCNGCGLCARICPFNAIQREGEATV